MMTEWFSLADLVLAQLPDLPRAEKALDNKLRQLRLASPHLARQVAGKTKPVWQYHVNILPPVSRAKLAFTAHSVESAESASGARSRLLWARFEMLSKDHRAICQERFDLLVKVSDMQKAGIKLPAVQKVLDEAHVSRSTFYDWRKKVEGVERADWLAALAPSFSSSAHGVVAEVMPCEPKAWEWLKSDYLRTDQPAFSACYRRMKEQAKVEGWQPIPSERTLQRRLDAEVPRAVQVLARDGKDRAKALFPAQRRSRGHLHAMQMVNMDGHKLDVFVTVPWATKPTRLYLLGIQDLFSGKIVSWRLSEAETWEAVRLVIGDMVEQFGIPDDIYLDNGRAFASKWISGGARTRFRFKVRDEDPRGLLVTLGITPHFTTPYAGQSKPIERAWRDLAEEVSKHPAMAGAYTGSASGDRNHELRPDVTRHGDYDLWRRHG
jgi:putative transposase